MRKVFLRLNSQTSVRRRKINVSLDDERFDTFLQLVLKFPV